jgi:MFS family permease
VRPGGRLQRLRRLAIDVAPLRASRDFRLLWAGSVAAAIGSQFARVGLYVQVFDLTRSPAAVGLLGVSGLGGSLLGTVVGASFLDAHDRRTTLLWTQLAAAAVAGVLVAGALGGNPPLALLHGANAATWFLASIHGPARQAATPRLVGEELMPAAVALAQAGWQIASIVGPAAAGVLIAVSGPAAAYAVDLVSYLVLFGAAIAMRPLPPEPSPVRATGLPALREGLQHVRRSRLLASTFVIDLVAMVFGMPAALFPVLAVERFDRGPEVVGLLFAAPAVGALVQTLTSGPITRLRRQGAAVIWAVAGWGAAIAAFGLVGDHLWWALGFLAIAGAADVVSAIFRSTILQVTVPDRLRGRLSSIFHVVVTGGPKLGDLEAGLVAALVSPAFSVVSGGIACIVGAGVVALAYPELRRYSRPKARVI